MQNIYCTNPSCRSGNVTPARAIVATQTFDVSGVGYVPGHGPITTTGTSQSQLAKSFTYDKPAAGVLEVVLTFMVWGLAFLVFVCTTFANINAGCVLIPVFFVAGISYALLRRAHYKRAQKNWEVNKLNRRFYCNNCHNAFEV